MIDVTTYLADGETLQVSVASTWESRKAQTNVSASQTTQLRRTDKAAQAGERSSRGDQTDRLFKRYSDAVRGGPGFEPVAAFLDKVEPVVQQAIADNLCTGASPQAFDWQGSAPVDVTVAHTLQGVDAQDANTAQLCCTSLSWSPTGQSVAAAYGRFDVEGWCSQPGYLCAWNLARSALSADKPDVKIETDSCLQCCCYHPSQPGLIAGGTFVGDVHVWDLAQEGDFQVFKSILSASSHQEAVTAVAWHKSSTDPLLQHETEFDLVVSLASDGRLLLWQWQKAQLLYGLELLHPHPETSKMVLWGGTCMYLPQQQLGHLDCTCLIGTEGGAVFRCSLDMSPASLGAFAQASSSVQKALVSTATKSRLCQHTGPVHAVHCSPHDSRLTASCGLDGQVKVSNSLTKQTLLELCPSDNYLFSAQWSPTRPMLLAIGTGDGRVVFYDVGKSKQQPLHVLDACGSSSPVYALAFNPKAPELFATVHQKTVQVWRLSSGLLVEHPSEKVAMHHLLSNSG